MCTLQLYYFLKLTIYCNVMCVTLQIINFRNFRNVYYENREKARNGTDAILHCCCLNVGYILIGDISFQLNLQVLDTSMGRGSHLICKSTGEI